MNNVREVVRHPAVKAYVTEQGLPTCAKDFTCGKVCPFHGTKRFGTHDVCLLVPYERLHRRESDGFIEPGRHCAVWSQCEIIHGVSADK